MKVEQARPEENYDAPFATITVSKAEFLQIYAAVGFIPYDLRLQAMESCSPGNRGLIDAARKAHVYAPLIAYWNENT